jgi:hypothetical protein
MQRSGQKRKAVEQYEAPVKKMRKMEDAIISMGQYDDDNFVDSDDQDQDDNGYSDNDMGDAGDNDDDGIMDDDSDGDKMPDLTDINNGRFFTGGI